MITQIYLPAFICPDINAIWFGFFPQSVVKLRSFWMTHCAVPGCILYQKYLSWLVSQLSWLRLWDFGMNLISSSVMLHLLLTQPLFEGVFRVQTFSGHRLGVYGNFMSEVTRKNSVSSESDFPIVSEIDGSYFMSSSQLSSTGTEIPILLKSIRILLWVHNLVFLVFLENKFCIFSKICGYYFTFVIVSTSNIKVAYARNNHIYIQSFLALAWGASRLSFISIVLCFQMVFDSAS